MTGIPAAPGSASAGTKPRNAVFAQRPPACPRLPGAGAGRARTIGRSYHAAERWLRATAERLRDCPCRDGCPSCVVSPKCGNGNEPLDKRAAEGLTRAILDG